MLSAELIETLLAFRRARDWEQFHNLRSLSASLLIECGELMEFTQWADDAGVDRIARERAADVEAEVADIAILLTYLTHDLGIDLEAAVRRKLAANERKYPVEKARGVSTEYDRL